MTTASNKTYDVFISHGPSENKLASAIAEDLKSVGLEAFHAGNLEPDTDIGDAIWQALAESRALIAVVSPGVPMRAMGMIEIGGASGWNKPIYLILNGPSSTKLPPGLDKYPVYPISRLDEVIRSIQSSFEPLNENQRAVVTKIYKDLNIPADQLSGSMAGLQKLTTRFNRITHKQFSEERLLTEILRMRKKGQLPRLRAAQRVK
jgi:hypothetical protein